jgi:hypothetical protein
MDESQPGVEAESNVPPKDDKSYGVGETIEFEL